MTDEAKALLAQVFHESTEHLHRCLHLDSGLWDCKVRASDAAKTEAGAKLLRGYHPGDCPYTEETAAAKERLGDCEEVVANTSRTLTRFHQVHESDDARIAALEEALRDAEVSLEGVSLALADAAGKVKVAHGGCLIALAGAAASESESDKQTDTSSESIRCQYGYRDGDFSWTCNKLESEHGEYEPGHPFEPKP